MKTLKLRFSIMALVALILMVALIFQLGSLTLAKGSELSVQADERMTRTTVLKGTRGRILDRNGVVLAYSETCYNVEFLRDANKRSNYDSAVYTEALLRAIDIIEAGGGTVINTSYIQMNENDELYYEWGVENEESISSRYYNFCSAMGFYVTEEISKDRSAWKTPESAYLDMCKSWLIPSELPFEKAVKLISIRQEVNLNNYRAYQPITIAYNVSMQVVAEIELHSAELPGLQTNESTTRIYPCGETAAHIVGYLQRNPTPEMIKDKGYSNDDYVGISGVEATMEDVLTGASKDHHGYRVIKVNRNGSEINEISVTPPTDGDDVMLTIDVPLQRVSDQALKDIIAYIHQKEEEKINKDENHTYTYTDSEGNIVKKDIKLAETGAIAVVNVNTGELLASSSYPSYDPNWFIQGLTDDQYEMLMGKKAEETTPMRNKVVSARLAYGSIFKMVTGFAGLMENKITLDETISDESPYILYYDKDNKPITKGAPSCWVPNPADHANQTIVDAIKNSCNYYFCEVAHRLGIDLLNEWAGNFGLTEKTNIETTGEAVGIIGGQKIWFDNTLPLDEQKTSMPRYIYNNLRSMLVRYLKSYMAGTNVNEDSNEIKNCALELLKLQDGDVSGKGADVRRIMNEYLAIPEGIISRQTWVSEILSQLVELQWKESQTIRAGFGQGSSLVTPIAVARYVAALANRGTVYDIHVIDRMLDPSGNIIKEITPTVHKRIDAPKEYWDAIHEGLKAVVSPEDFGTAAKAFTPGWKYISNISGKTGTAQIGTVAKIDIQNTSWFVTYTPRENAEIAVVVCIPYGLSGTSSAGAIEDIVTYYYSRKEASAPENLIDINGIAP
ncbi:MAG: penicillin-binding transpeptidase domain-containing protein [Clostridia bacterium]